MNFGERLKRIRNERKITQEELAGTIGVKRSTIAGYETKGKEPQYSTLVKISKTLNCSADYLLGNNKDTDSSELDLCFTKLSQRNDMKQLLKQTEKLHPDSVNRIIKIIDIIEEEIDGKEEEMKIKKAAYATFIHVHRLAFTNKENNVIKSFLIENMVFRDAALFH